ncbi:hypothetical protein [Thiohalorhabdus methylotrophus]|uniref:Low-complexity protein n=1 Tax=Thiohalorhabdus methylotrophus TaxID=3242694 RepID=A0ABV4TZC6_9GAMM
MTDSKRHPRGGPAGYMLGATMAGGLALGAVSAQADEADPFRVAELSSGYMVADSHAEGKCGGGASDEKKGKEGKCGGMDDGGSAESGHAGDKEAAKKKGGEGKCGEGKCASS